MRSVKIVRNHVGWKGTTAFEISILVNYFHDTNFEVIVINHAEDTNYCTMMQYRMYQYRGGVED
jgi:hypothetical protein